jgi:hypothetical protein
VKTDSTGKYTLSDEGKDALLSVETVEKISESTDRDKGKLSNVRRNVIWKSAFIVLSICLLTSSAIAIYENSQAAIFQNQITSLQNKVTSLQTETGTKDRMIDYFNQSLTFAQLSLNIRQLTPRYLSMLPTMSGNGNSTKIYLESVRARYDFLFLSRFIIINSTMNNGTNSRTFIVSTSSGNVTTGAIVIFGNASSLFGIAYPNLGQYPLAIHGVVRNDYTPADANPNDPNAPIGNSTSRYASFVTLTVKLYSQNGSVIQESGQFTKEDQTIVLFNSGTGSFDILLNPSVPYVDHYEVYVSYLSANPQP